MPERTISSARASSARAVNGRGVTDEPAGSAGTPPFIDPDAVARALINAGVPTTAENRARLFPPSVDSPATSNNGAARGPSDPFDVLSDVFRNTFGSDAPNRPNAQQQALTPVTTGGGGGASLVWILLLAGIGGAIYLYYRNKGG